MVQPGDVKNKLKSVSIYTSRNTVSYPYNTVHNVPRTLRIHVTVLNDILYRKSAGFSARPDLKFQDSKRFVDAQFVHIIL